MKITPRDLERVRAVTDDPIRLTSVLLAIWERGYEEGHADLSREVAEHGSVSQAERRCGRSYEHPAHNHVIYREVFRCPGRSGSRS